MFNIIFIKSATGSWFRLKNPNLHAKLSQEILFNTFLAKGEDIFMQLCRILPSNLLSPVVSVKEQIGCLY